MSDEDRINIYILSRATKRLNRELTIISKDPIPGIDLRDNQDNILEWHFVIHGKKDTPYYGGMYHGKLIFPSNFPFSPPTIIFLTPNGRFKTNERICFSLSDFYPENWKPEYSVTTVLQGILDFMHDSTETIGSIETSESEKRELAESSSIHNGKDTIFCHIFPQLCERNITNSEDSSLKNTIFPVKERTPLPDEITPPPKTQSPTSTEITLPPADLTSLPRNFTEKYTCRKLPTPSIRYRGAVHSYKNLPSLPKEIIPQQSPPTEMETSLEREKNPLGNRSILKQGNIALPSHTTPSFNKTFYDHGLVRTRPSKRKVRFETNSQTLESNELDVRRAHSFSEYGKLPSTPIRSSGATHSQKNFPSSPKEIFPLDKAVHPSGIAHFQRMSDEDRTNSFNLRRATKRLNRELTIIAEDPIPGIDIRASEDSILEWHFVIHGKEDTPYYGGMYHGKLIFPSNFPFSPPSIIFLTPNGRFKTNERICFSISDFHPEQWKPSYSVVDLLYGVREFMHEDTETTGSIETSKSAKKQLAKSSSIHNGNDTIFRQLFPQMCGRILKDSEDGSSESIPSKNTIFSVRKKTELPVKTTLLPRTQSLTLTEITLPPTNLAPVLHPTHSTPSVNRTMFSPVKLPIAQPSSREVRPLLQNVSQRPLTISSTYSTPPSFTSPYLDTKIS